MTDPVRPETPAPLSPATPLSRPSADAWTAPAPPEVAVTPTMSDAAPVGQATPAGVIAPAAQTAVPPGPAAAKRGRSGGGVLNAVLVIAAAVAIGGVAFAVGRTTAPASAATVVSRGNLGGIGPTGSFVPGGNGGPGFVRGGLGAGLTVRGTVESVDGDTLTIRTDSGQTIEVKTGTSTTYNTQAPASASDVKTGSTVQVQLEFDGTAVGQPGASAAPAGPLGTADSVTVIP